MAIYSTVVPEGILQGAAAADRGLRLRERTDGHEGSPPVPDCMGAAARAHDDASGTDMPQREGAQEGYLAAGRRRRGGTMHRPTTRKTTLSP